MTARRRLPQWVPWTLALLALTVLALLDRRDETAVAEPDSAEPDSAQLSHD